jgi:hypothetical protein
LPFVYPKAAAIAVEKALDAITVWSTLKVLPLLDNPVPAVICPAPEN